MAQKIDHVGIVVKDLEAAIELYGQSEAQRAAAKAAFTSLLDDPNAAEYHVTCHYYLGLIELRDGLDQSALARRARTRRTMSATSPSSVASRSPWPTSASSILQASLSHSSRGRGLRSPSEQMVFWRGPFAV
jgi:hypothetical protein